MNDHLKNGLKRLLLGCWYIFLAIGMGLYAVYIYPIAPIWVTKIVGLLALYTFMGVAGYGAWECGTSAKFLIVVESIIAVVALLLVIFAF